MKRNKSLQSYARLNSMSKRTHTKMRERRAIVQEVFKAHPFCQVCGIAKSTEPHEPWTRARGGPVLDKNAILAVCHYCHRYIHEHPAWSEERGFLIPSHEGQAWLDRGGVNQ